MEEGGGWAGLVANDTGTSGQTNTTAGTPGNYFQNILVLVPWCTSAPAPQQALFHVAHALFLVGFVAPSSRVGLLIMHSLLIVGFLVYSTWAWNVVCARDVFAWGFTFTLLNLGQTLYVLYQTRPVKTDRELEAVYNDLFRPLNVERLVFKRLVSSECCQVTSLHAGEAYAMQQLTRTDRLGLLLSGRVNVLAGGHFLHAIAPMEFLDSPEFESSRATHDDKFKVSIVAATTSRYLFWKRSSLEYLFLKDQHLATVLSTLVARDITTKLYSMNSKIVTEKGSHLDIRLPSLTSSLNPSLVGVPQPGSQRRGSILPPILQRRDEDLNPSATEGGTSAPLVGEGGPQLGGGYGVPLGYSNNVRELLTGDEGSTFLPNGGLPPPNKMEHPLH